MNATGPDERRSITLLLSVLVCAVLVASCGDQVQKAKPPEKPAAEMPAGHPDIGHGASRPSGGDPFSEGSEAGKPAMSAAKAADPERVVYAGEIAVDPAVPLGEKYTVYVTTVYSPQERAPVLLKRFDNPKFPFRFELREKDTGMGARQSDKPLYVRAMISDTGEAMKSRNRTVSDQAYAPYTTDIKLTIKPEAPK
jgi:hypothetical protein